LINEKIKIEVIKFRKINEEKILIGRLEMLSLTEKKRF